MADNVQVNTGSGPNIATDDIGGIHHQLVKVEFGALDSATLVSSTNPLPTAPIGFMKTVVAALTRPATAPTYTAGDMMSNTGPTPIELTACSRINAGSGILTDIVIFSNESPALSLTGDLWLFDSTVTAVADDGVFTVTDADIAKLVAVVPFALAPTAVTTPLNSYAHLRNLGISFTCVTNDDLFFLIKVTNAYIAVASEVITVRAKIIQGN